MRKRLPAQFRASTAVLALAFASTALIPLNSAVAQERNGIVVTAVSSFSLLEPLIPEFEAATGIDVELQILPYDQLRQRSIADFVSGTANSDVYAQDITWLGEWASNGYSLPLDDLIARDISPEDLSDILPGAYNAVTQWNGQTWSLPVTAVYFLLYYRADPFEAAGLSAPVTFDDVNAAAAALVSEEKNQYGIAMPYQRGESLSTWFLATYAGAGGKLLRDPENGDFTPTLDSPEALEVLENYVGWLEYSANGAVGYSRPEQTIAMQTGRAAMAATFSVNGTEFVRPEVSTITDSVGYTTMPRLSADAEPVLPFGGFGMAVNAKTQNVEESWEFVKWLSSSETQTKLGFLNGQPVRYSAIENEEIAARFPWLQEIAGIEKAGGNVFADFRPRYPFFPQIQEVLALQLNNAATGVATPAEALAAANEEIRQIVTAAGYAVN